MQRAAQAALCVTNQTCHLHARPSKACSCHNCRHERNSSKNHAEIVNNCAPRKCEVLMWRPFRTPAPRAPGGKGPQWWVRLHSVKPLRLPHHRHCALLRASLTRSSLSKLEAQIQARRNMRGETIFHPQSLWTGFG